MRWNFLIVRVATVLLPVYVSSIKAAPGLGSSIKTAIAQCPPLLATFTHADKTTCQHYGGVPFRGDQQNSKTKDIQALLSALENRCEIKICNDGSKPTGSNCAVGNCNIFGRNCDGGCLGAGNTADEAKRLFIKSAPPGIINA